MRTTTFEEVDQAVSELVKVRKPPSIPECIELIQQSIHTTYQAAQDWVELAWKAKRIPDGENARAEDILTGPVATLRFLQLVRWTFQDIQRDGKPKLPHPIDENDGQIAVKVFPTRWLYDSLFFGGMTAETWLEPGITENEVTAKRNDNGGVVVVLGAGNVSSIPATDALSKILLESCRVILKMNPVNAYLGDVFENAFKPFIDANQLRIVYGGADVGAHLVKHPDIDGVHITGSIESHDRIVWGRSQEQAERKANQQPVLQKEITSELSNVSPWAIVPGQYTNDQLNSMAENLVASITNNVSFNCIATKVLLTSKNWGQREQYLQLVQKRLSESPMRYAYYPGAGTRYARFASQVPEDPELLPWKLIEDADTDSDSHLMKEESFTCVCIEKVIDAETDTDFLQKAVNVMNNEIWGTLAATLNVSPRFQDEHKEELNAALKELRYGTIGINQWPALAFAWMSPPWGGISGTTLQDPQSGIGFVHNTFFLNRPQKTILRGPITPMPKPIWYSTHKHPEKIAWKMLSLCHKPSIWKLPGISFAALTG